jgi:hypothetical protein
MEDNSDATKAFAILCAKAAMTCRRRGETEKTFEWCVRRLRVSEVFDAEVFSLLLSCVKGQSEPEIIHFLSGLLPSDAPTQAHALAEGLVQDGFQTAFKYFVRKQVEKGIALKKHFLQLLILNGNYQETVVRAMEMKDSMSDDLFSEIVFLTSVCSGGSIDPDVEERLNPIFAALCHAMKASGAEIGGPQVGAHGQTDALAEESGATRQSSETKDESGRVSEGHNGEFSGAAYEAGFIYRMFNQLVFFSGLQDAYRFLMLFSRDPKICFFVESRYFFDNGLYDNVLFSKFAAGLDDAASQEVLLLARILSGRHAEALAQIKEALSAGRANTSLLNHLITVADKASPHIAGEARSLYDKHSYLYDEFTDCEDVIKTGLVFDRHGKHDRKAFKEMRLDGFKRFLASEIYPTDHLSHLMTIAQAAAIYENKGMDTMALRCFIRLYACAYKESETIGDICRIFKKLGNGRLSAELEKAGGSGEAYQ